MSKTFNGIIKARVVEARFALSGKISSVSKRTGDSVKKWNLIASLDRKILQMELDRQLSDYEKVRADWDGFCKKYPDPQDDNKYTKVEKQAALNASVKDVEICKANLDQCDLFSPVDGIILDDSGITPGTFVTPAGSSVKIVDTTSYYFEVEINQKDIKYLEKLHEATITIDNLGITLKSPTSQILSDGKKFLIQISTPGVAGLLLGLNGKATF